MHSAQHTGRYREMYRVAYISREHAIAARESSVARDDGEVLARDADHRPAVVLVGLEPMLHWPCTEQR